METRLKIKEGWSGLKKELKQKYAALTDLDLAYTEGREDELLATISRKIGKTKDEVSNVIKELQTKMAGKSIVEREGVHSEKSRSARNLTGEGEGIDADPRHIEASKKH
jgi:uncharacterized protein YjbJ (UPF0337 family)